ncbi:universal stress protein [Paraburkholderia bryophila]|uniref:Nucleotide-binding universal stress UspA family protein n=1 Tax=Paraburkholderia bryophila TaxID=420952 RepID=A0A7Y9W4F0_9BURK|nr:universal stress protein [Paraburkholderia bryophila]NYH14110.1 nucleotide-binding universal stress UspA family protein [Paraburkholderia bryophila]
MYKRILVALDGSRAARRALGEAVKIARAAGATIVAVYVVVHAARLVETSAGLVDERPTSEEDDEAARAALAQAHRIFRTYHLRGVAREIDAYGEDVAAVLARAASGHEADLVVMGTHGRHGMCRVLLGSVAESFVRIANAPVLLVRHASGVEPEIDSDL